MTIFFSFQLTQDEWSSDSEKIRIRANLILKKFQSAFVVPEGSDFWSEFETRVEEFK